MRCPRPLRLGAALVLGLTATLPALAAPPDEAWSRAVRAVERARPGTPLHDRTLDALLERARADGLDAPNRQAALVRLVADDARRAPAVVSLLEEAGDVGQPGLAALALTAPSVGWRDAAASRLLLPPDAAVIDVLRQALRSGDESVVARAAALTSLLDATPLLPDLADALVARRLVEVRVHDRYPARVGIERATFAGIPMVGGGAGGAIPLAGTFTSGVVLGSWHPPSRSAVVRRVRPEVHRALTAMARWHAGAAVDLGGDPIAWRRWIRASGLADPT